MVNQGWRSLNGLLAIGLSVAGCIFYRGPAEKIVLDAEILVTMEDGSPAKGQRIYVVESFGNTETITVDTVTDESGRIFLKGTYCSPMTVASESGAIVIRPPAETHYSIGPMPGSAGLVKVYGEIDPRITPAMIASRRRSC